jgi:hypothetical protein
MINFVKGVFKAVISSAKIYYAVSRVKPDQCVDIEYTMLMHMSTYPSSCRCYIVGREGSLLHGFMLTLRMYGSNSSYKKIYASDITRFEIVKEITFPKFKYDERVLINCNFAAIDKGEMVIIIDKPIWKMDDKCYSYVVEGVNSRYCGMLKEHHLKKFTPTESIWQEVLNES